MAKGDPIPDRVGLPVLVLFAAIMIAAFLPFANGYASHSGIDFEAFYCGGRVMASGANPYLVEPLHACESRVYWKDPNNRVVVPVPQLPVTIAAFVPFGVMPYVLARIAWMALLCALLVASAWAMWKLYGVPWAGAAIAVLLSGVISLTLGQLVPWCVFGMVLAAYGLRTTRAWAFAIGLALLSAQPSVFIAVALAAAVIGNMRVRLIAGAVSAGVVAGSIAVAGWQTNWTYIHTILPLHAYAELSNSTQLSLSGLLAQLGVPANVALAAGAVSYVLALVFAVIAARSLSRIFEDESMIALVPPAFAVFLGTFVHLQLYALAVPLAAVLAYRWQSRTIASALFAIALPWQWAAITFVLIPSLSVGAVLFARLWLVRSLATAAAIGAASAAAMFGLALWYIRTAPLRLPPILAPIHPQALAVYTWIDVERTFYGAFTNNDALGVARLLSIGGLACVLIASLAPSFSRRERFA